MATNKWLNTRVIAEISIMLALAVVFQLVAMVLPRQPQGGSISITMLPLIILAYRHGLKVGILSGMVYGILDAMITGFAFVGIHWGVLFFDYLLAFGSIGFSALVFKLNKRSLKIFVLGTILGTTLRYFFHFLSGVILFSEYAPEGQPVVIYSLIYNGWYMVPSIVLTIVIGAALYVRLKETLLNA